MSCEYFWGFLILSSYSFFLLTGGKLMERNRPQFNVGSFSIEANEEKLVFFCFISNLGLS
jgi:hypothetical protein